MIDFHSHILPGIDDGAASVEDSLALLSTLSKQGVKRVAATPHFYAHMDSPERFLEKRAAAAESLELSLTSKLPEIKLGAEVFYYSGISRMEQIHKLCLEGTPMLLLEMPMSSWSASMVKEIVELNCSRGVHVVLAHIERYLSLVRDEFWDDLLQNGVMMQVNASFFLSRLTRGKAVKMLRRGKIHFLGSDCHNMETRPPRIGKAAEYIRRKAGSALFLEFCERNMTVWEGKH